MGGVGAVMITTGRYRGNALSDVPKQYLRWMVRQARVRPDLRITIKRHLGMPTAAVVDFKAAAAGEGRQGSDYPGDTEEAPTPSLCAIGGVRRNAGGHRHGAV